MDELDAESKRKTRAAETAEQEKMKLFNQIDNKNYYIGTLGSLGEIKISLHTIVTLSLLQFPAVILALYGVICALISSKENLAKFKDFLLALPLVLVPFFFTEIFAVININYGLNCIFECIKTPLKLCGKCLDTGLNKMNLLKFLPQIDETGKTDQDLGLQLIKLTFGSCLQLCYQSVLLAAYTPMAKFGYHQVLSIVSSTLMISRSVALIIKYEIPQVQDPNLPLWKKLTLGLESVRHLLYHRLPLALTSLIFQTGTLVMAIVVAEWYAVIYVVLVLLLNMVISLSVQKVMEALKKTEAKLKVTFKYADKETPEDIMSQSSTLAEASFHPVIRAMFVSWANLFATMRPVEHMSYSRIAPMLLLQLPRFILNVFTLVILLFLTYTPTSAINSNVVRHEYPLIITYSVVFLAGVINQILLVSAFYTRSKTTAKAGNVHEEIGLEVKVEARPLLEEPNVPNPNIAAPNPTPTQRLT
jgi:hypothetical protein